MAEERSPIQHVLVMRRTEVETNVHRFYALMIEHDLFGRVVLVRRWGRFGTRGRCLVDDLACFWPASHCYRIIALPGWAGFLRKPF
jgi:WGR domain-containing protein